MVKASAAGDIPRALYPRFAPIRVFDGHQRCDVLGIEIRVLFERTVNRHAGKRHILFAFGLRVKHLLSFANDGAARCWLNEALLHPGMTDAKRVGRAECLQWDRLKQRAIIQRVILRSKR